MVYHSVLRNCSRHVLHVLSRMVRVGHQPGLGLAISAMVPLLVVFLRQKMGGGKAHVDQD